MIVWGLKDTVSDDNLSARPLQGQSVALLFLLCVRMCDVCVSLVTLYWFTHDLLALMPMVPLHVSGVCVSIYCVLKYI